MFSSSSSPTNIFSIRRFGRAHYLHAIQTRLFTFTKKARGCAVPSLFSSEAPCQASFRPLPSGLQVWVLYIGKQTVRIYRPSNWSPSFIEGYSTIFQPRGPQHHTDESTQFFTRARLEGTELLGMIGPRPTLKSYSQTLKNYLNYPDYLDVQFCFFNQRLYRRYLFQPFPFFLNRISNFTA